MKTVDLLVDLLADLAIARGDQLWGLAASTRQLVDAGAAATAKRLRPRLEGLPLPDGPRNAIALAFAIGLLEGKRARTLFARMPPSDDDQYSFARVQVDELCGDHVAVDRAIASAPDWLLKYLATTIAIRKGDAARARALATGRGRDRDVTGGALAEAQALVVAGKPVPARRIVKDFAAKTATRRKYRELDEGYWTLAVEQGWHAEATTLARTQLEVALRIAGWVPAAGHFVLAGYLVARGESALAERVWRRRVDRLRFDAERGTRWPTEQADTAIALSHLGRRKEALAAAAAHEVSFAAALADPETHAHTVITTIAMWRALGDTARGIATIAAAVRAGWDRERLFLDGGLLDLALEAARAKQTATPAIQAAAGELRGALGLPAAAPPARASRPAARGSKRGSRPPQ